MKKRVKTGLDAATDFLNITVHELRTPIVPLKGYLTLLHDNPKKYGLNEKSQEFVHICLRNVDRLENLIEGIIEISKLEAGKIRFEMESVDLEKLVQNVVADLSPLAANKNLVLKVKFKKNVLMALGNPNRISQVLSNLVKNAIEFTNKGSVTITARPQGKKIQVGVLDTGIGISKEEMPHIFTKFFRGQKSRAKKVEGSGLGLSICKQIIKAHKGKIWAKSGGAGKGSEFYFTLPSKP